MRGDALNNYEKIALGYTSKCHIFLGAKDADGYGRVSLVYANERMLI